MMKKLFISQGFTLIEIIIYVSLVAIFVTGAIDFAWDVIYGRERSFQAEVVNQGGRAAIERIAHEIRRTENVVSIDPGRLELERDGVNTVIELTSGTLFLTSGAEGPYAMISNMVEVTDFSVTDLSSSDLNSKNLLVEIAMRQAIPPIPGAKIYETVVSDSIEFNTQFNQARGLAIDLSEAIFTGSNRVERAKIRNTGDSDVTIDQIEASWTSGNGNMLEIQIGGGGIEWGGISPSGGVVDIVDYTLVAGGGQEPINNVTFSTNIEGDVLTMAFIMIDGSVAKSKMLISGGGPAPTPPGTCLQTCVDSSFSGGICRRNIAQCNSNGETNVPVGDQYCTVPPDDTCCCLP